MRPLPKCFTPSPSRPSRSLSEQTIPLRLTDQYARPVRQFNRHVRSGPNQIEVLADQLPNGPYFLRLP